MCNEGNVSLGTVGEEMNVMSRKYYIMYYVNFNIKVRTNIECSVLTMFGRLHKNANIRST